VSRPVPIVLACGVAALAVAVMVRYARQAGESLAFPPGDDAAVTVRLASNPAPVSPFRLTGLDALPIDTTEWKGKVTLLNFWATWCPPCRAEIPDLVALQARYADSLQIIGIADDYAEDLVRRFTREMGVNYRNAMATPAIKARFRIRALPTTLVIDRDGRVAQRHVGQIKPVVIEQEVRALLGLPVRGPIERFAIPTETPLGKTAQATEIPGLDLAALGPEARRAALVKLNSDKCTCGCELTLAACRINDPACEVSLPLAKKVVAAVGG
jgi:thiol-disulfide isomerase/thioredoxin